MQKITHLKLNIFLISLCLLLVNSVSCGRCKNVQQKSFSKDTNQSLALSPSNLSLADEPRVISLAELVQNQSQFIGKKVSVKGKFMGWKGTCTQGPPITRSDWMLEDEGFCVYVHGSVPPGCNSWDSSCLGKSVSMEAFIRFNGEIFYLELSNFIEEE